VVVRLLVAHAGTVELELEPEPAAEEEAGWATVVSVEPPPLLSLVADGADVVAVEEDDVLSLDPHAVNARPAVTSAMADIPRRAVLLNMVVPLP
jgi:hypothetical protein